MGICILLYVWASISDLPTLKFFAQTFFLEKVWLKNTLYLPTVWTYMSTCTSRFNKTTDSQTYKQTLEISEQFLSCLKTCLPNVYTMSTDMFEPCLRYVYTHVYTMLEVMFTQYLMTCLNDIRSHIYSMWENMFTPSLNTCLHQIWNHFYTLYETSLHNIFRNICNMLKEMLSQCWETWVYYV